MNILITGAAGLLGSRFAEYLNTEYPDITVVGIDDLSGGYMSNVPKRTKFFQGNAGSAELLDHLFRIYHFDLVYHFAAYAAEGLSPFIRQFNYTNNLVVTANIINKCIQYKVKRLIFTSSMAVYGVGNPPFNEVDARRPIDPYGIAKSTCEQDIEIACAQHGLDYCIIRPHNVYGRNQNIWDSYRNFIGITIYKGLIGDPITIYGDGLQTRAFSEMSDCLRPLYLAGVTQAASQQIINLGGIHESTILDVANIVRDLSGSSIIHLEPRHEVKHAHSSWKKSIEYLDFKHTISLQDGVTSMWAWAQRQPKRDRFIWNSYELDSGLYSYWKPENLKDGVYK